MKQLSLLEAIDPTTALARFRIPHCGSRITYGDVSKKLARLWCAKRFDQASQLAREASVLFKEPYWLKRYAAQ